MKQIMKQIIKHIFGITTISTSSITSGMPTMGMLAPADPPLPASRHEAFKQLLSMSKELPRPRQTQDRRI